MKKLKTVICICLMLATVFAISACGSDSQYKDDVSIDSLSSAIINAVPEENGYTTMGNDYISLEFSGATDITENTSAYCVVASTTSSNVNEFGIFHVNGDKTKVKDAVQSYVDQQTGKLRSMLEMYSADELSKLDEAKVTVYGNYVIYTIFSKDQTDLALKAVSDLLTAE